MDGVDALLSPCPVCFRPLRGELHEDAGEVWLAKRCAQHGAFRARYWDSAEHLRWTDTFAGGEACCGPAKRCVAVVDVTQRCNLRCAFCFASSHPGLAEPPRREVSALLATVLREAGPVPLQLSGGEPTTRSDLPGIVREARGLGFRHVMVNTNGLMLGTPGYAAALKEAGVSAIYLQFDGLDDDVYRAIRAAPLLAAKLRALDACRDAGLPVVLVPTVVRGVNDHQLGGILGFALDRLDVVRGVVFQPVARMGRWSEDGGHLSIAGVARRVAAQTSYLGERDLLPFPCCSPRCAAATVLLRSEGGAVPLTRYVTPGLYRRLLAAVGERNYLDVLAGTEDGALAAVAGACGCGIGLPGAARELLRRSLVVTVQAFMDAETCDLARLGQCCIVVPTPAGTLAPFCGWNLTDRSGTYALRARHAAGPVVLRA